MYSDSQADLVFTSIVEDVAANVPRPSVVVDPAWGQSRDEQYFSNVDKMHLMEFSCKARVCNRVLLQCVDVRNKIYELCII